MAETVGRYKLLEEIGHGGFAVVYRAQDTVLNRQVALKELRPVLLTNALWVERFRREARTIARLDHPHIVPIYDVDEIDGRLFIVMRLVDGPNLKELIAVRGVLPWAEAMEIITTVSEALNYAHGQGILHRDLKPANILLDSERGPLLGDFGMAKLAGEGTISVTGDVVGTPHYIAPEAWDGAAATIQTDIYALGCILYELLIGEKIFHGDTPLAVMSAHLKPLALPETWPEGVPSGVGEVFKTALARHPADRYATAGELAQALNLLRPGEPPPPRGLLKISTLGGLQLTCAGESVQKIGSRRVEALLVYLACTGHAQPREVLADLLWDDRPQQQAMSNLRTVLTGLRQHFGPYLTITRETVALNPATAVWLDATALTESLPQDAVVSAESVARVEQAVDLYRGDFLEGFHLRGARNFEEWLTVEREHLRQQVLDALNALMAYHLAQGNYQAGIAHTRHLLHLDPLLEEAHQQLMRLLVYSGQRSAALAQYETCRRLLADEFGVEPTAETNTLFEDIQAGTLATPPPNPTPMLDVSLKLPAFLQQKQKSAAAKVPLFVSRECQLAALDTHLESALAGQGHVVFVTGEAGRGKTALMTAFARRAQETHLDLVVAYGNCNAYGGIGDPYLPFRDVLGMLSGDVESKWRAGSISRDHAQRLWNLLPQTAQTLVDVGPDLLNVFVPGQSLLERARVASANEAAWYSQLHALVENGRAAVHLGQQQLFEQYLQVLQTLARQLPLLLWLDDLQWADDASLNLLFHLGRRLPGSRILIVGAYRPSEVTLKRSVAANAEQQHPLQPVVNEFKCLFGDIQIDLGQIPAAENQAFVETLLDSEPNRLQPKFRKALYRHTKGHPLFTVELLRDMQSRGDLVQDEANQWIEGATLDWDAMPSRVEAVIEQRLDRLDEELQEMLTIASVEGETFTVQMVARLHNVSERQVLRCLSRELERRHRLVREQGEVMVSDRRLTRYRFNHILFQHYLYNQLSQTERRLLHGDMAEILEELYAGHTDQIAAQLARHYVEAGESEKALKYLLQAGDQTRLAYAHEAAIAYYRQALTILKKQNQRERAARTLMKLGLTYHNAFNFDESRQAYEEGFALWQQVDKPQQTSVPLLPPAPHPLRIGGGIQPPTLDWTIFTDDNSDILISQLFRGLVRVTSEMELVPDVAKSWEILENGEKYIFHLREDVFWSDGTPVTAGDFEFAWKRLLNPTVSINGIHLLYDIRGAGAFHRGETSNPDWVGVYALNDLTLAVELEEPAGYFLYVLAGVLTYPMPRHVVVAHPENWTDVDKIVTNGPFELTVWDPNGRVVLTRNPAYHGQFTGKVAQLEFISHEKPSVIIDMYSADKLDIVNFPVPQLDQVLQRHAGDYVPVPGLITFFIDFDVSRPPFDDPRARRAFALAIDQISLAKKITQDTAAPGTGGLVPVGMPGHLAEIGLPYDPHQARQLLVEAGYPGGQNFPSVDLLIWPRHMPTGEYLLAQWRENLGVDVRLEVEEWTKIFERWSNNPSYLHLHGWFADNPDPDNFLKVAFEAVVRWRDETYDRLVKKAGQITNQQERLELYRQADRILIDEAAILPLTYPYWNLLVKPWVKRLPTSAAGWWQFEDVAIDPMLRPGQQVTLPLSDNHVLRWQGGEALTLDPAMCPDGSSLRVISQLFSGLVETTAEVEVVPDVAQRWEVLEEGRKYIFYLRDNVFWSDGVPVTARDFEYAWKRVLDPAMGCPSADLLYPIKGARAFHQGKISNPNDIGVKALNEVTLVVELECPTGYFLYALAHCTTYPVPRHIVQTYGEVWTAVENIVTNGPFNLKSWQQGETMILGRNPQYHGRSTGNVEHVELSAETDSSASLSRYETNSLDILDITLFSPVEIDHARQRYTADYVSLSQLATRYIGFNPNKPPFSDPQIRRAFALATDQYELANLAHHGHHTPALGGFVPPGMPGHSADIGLPYDPHQARQLLAEAGYPNGDGFPVVEMVMWRPYIPLATALQKQWRDNLGIEMRWEYVGYDEFINSISKDMPHMFIFGWRADFLDPDNFLRSGFTWTGWNDEIYDSLLEQAQQTLDHGERINLYKTADKYLMEEAVLVPLVYVHLHLLVKPWVRSDNWLAPTRWWFWKDALVDPSLKPTRRVMPSSASHVGVGSIFGPKRQGD